MIGFEIGYVHYGMKGDIASFPVGKDGYINGQNYRNEDGTVKRVIEGDYSPAVLIENAKDYDAFLKDTLTLEDLYHYNKGMEQVEAVEGCGELVMVNAY